MKKVISISAEKWVIEEFTTLANDFWTNRTNLISMFMVDFINNKRVYFWKKTVPNEVIYDNFSAKELNELKNEWSKAMYSINNSLKTI